MTQILNVLTHTIKDQLALKRGQLGSRYLYMSCLKEAGRIGMFGYLQVWNVWSRLSTTMHSERRKCGGCVKFAFWLIVYISVPSNKHLSIHFLCKPKSSCNCCRLRFRYQQQFSEVISHEIELRFAEMLWC